MTLHLSATVLLAGALALVVSVPVLGDNDSSSSAMASASSAAATSDSSTAVTPDTRSDTDIVADGKHIWRDAGCYNCHGTNGQGGHSADFPKGPNLRTSALDPETMLLITECGIPGTRMPAWLKGAYTETACYGDETGPAPTGVLIAGAYSEAELKDLIAYVQTDFMKQPMPAW